MEEISQGQYRHVVGIVGGATAGSAAAEVLADQGVLVVVFEQNDRPYGKIEDGLPRWHAKQRKNEYVRINARLNRRNVLYVPRTGLGRDVSFEELAADWNFSALLLANGAWKDRPLAIPGIEQFVGHGLVYQNRLIHWFNHKNEASYSGPRYEIREGSIVIGGGLASIDVVKVVQLELYQNALRARGIETDMHEMEFKGIPDYCKAHGLDAAELGVRNCTLYYRRRLEDMPLASVPEDATPEQVQKTESVRRRILDKCREKYIFEFRPCHAPLEALVEDGRMVGLRFIRTQVEGRKVTQIPGSEVEIRSELTISSIGSIPEPIPGIESKGEYYRFKDTTTGEYLPRQGVYGAGNVITGQGNILVSLKHGRTVASHLVEKYLGVADPNLDLRQLPVGLDSMSREAAEDLLDDLTRHPPLAPDQVQRLLERVRRRQIEVGYSGDYAAWIAAVTPADLE